MTDPEMIQLEATHAVLHAWIGAYLNPQASTTASSVHETFVVQFESQAHRLRESAILLQAALEKMRLANEKLAARMAEHKAFFAKYHTSE